MELELKTSIATQATGKAIEIEGKEPKAQGEMAGQHQTQQYPANAGVRYQQSEQRYLQGQGKS